MGGGLVGLQGEGFEAAFFDFELFFWAVWCGAVAVFGAVGLIFIFEFYGAFLQVKQLIFHFKFFDGQVAAVGKLEFVVDGGLFVGCNFNDAEAGSAASGAFFGKVHFVFGFGVVAFHVFER